MKGGQVSITIDKGKDDRVGLAIVKNGNKLEINKILDGGILSSSSVLRSGMELVSINGESVIGKTSVQVCDELARTEGEITIVANRPPWPPGSLVTCTIEKPTPESKLGIGLGQKTSNGRIAITSLKEDSLAYNSDLDEGMIIRAVNNVKCLGRSSQQVGELLAEAQGIVVIVAQVPLPTDKDGNLPPLIASKPAPKGVDEGGVWEERKYYGPTSIMASVIGIFFFLVPGLIPICYPLDSQEVYILDNRVYDKKGDCISVMSPQK